MTLPNRRRQRSGDTKHKGKTVHVTVGFYPDGRPGEIFAYGFKTGSDQQGERDQTCMLWSKLMQQHGFSLDDFLRYVSRDDKGNPHTMSGTALVYAIAELAYG